MATITPGKRPGKRGLTEELRDKLGGVVWDGGVRCGGEDSVGAGIAAPSGIISGIA